MPSASNTSNSSNIRSRDFVVNLQTSLNSRLVIKLTNERPGFLDPTLTIGDVIRYDTASGSYKKAIANNLYTAEIFGVIERIDNDGGLIVVTYGSINYPTDLLINTTGFNSGGNDIYFLSDQIPGKLQNIAPSIPGRVVKPIYQTAPHNNFTGSIMNYVGYVIQG